MPIVVDAYETDGGGGYFVQFTDPDQPVTGYIHVTPELLEDLAVQHRIGRGASCDRIDACCVSLRDPVDTDHVRIVEEWRAAYEELVDDIKELRQYGLRADTPHRVLQTVRGGFPVPDEWLRDELTGLASFAAARREAQ